MPELVGSAAKLWGLLVKVNNCLRLQFLFSGGLKGSRNLNGSQQNLSVGRGPGHPFFGWPFFYV